VSDPHSSSDSEVEPDADNERSSGEAALDREADLKQEEAVKREDRRRGAAEPKSEEQAAEEDAEEVEGEWHAWILAAIVVIGIALFFAPRFFLPELLGSLGVFLAVTGVLGFAGKWAIGRRR
jgi:hypothetical protein